MIKIIILSSFFIANSISYKVSIVKSLGMELGEGPHYDEDTQSLYFVDVFSSNKTIFRYALNERRVYPASILGESAPSFIIPIENCRFQFAVGLAHSVKIIHWDGVSPEANVICTVFDVESSLPENRFNDAKADPRGRFYGGTFGSKICGIEQTASFYRYIDGKGAVEAFSNVKLSNGLAWNTETNKMYYSDSCRREIMEFDWDPETGDICNSRSLYNFRNGSKFPPFVTDGMAIDNEGFLYVATFNGSTVYKIDPKTLREVMKIEMPTRIIASVAFGGSNLDILFVVSGSRIVDFEGVIGGKLDKPAGSLFMVTDLGAKGKAGTKLKNSFASCAKTNC